MFKLSQTFGVPFGGPLSHSNILGAANLIFAHVHLDVLYLNPKPRVLKFESFGWCHLEERTDDFLVSQHGCHVQGCNLRQTHCKWRNPIMMSFFCGYLLIYGVTFPKGPQQVAETSQKSAKARNVLKPSVLWTLG